MYDYIPMTQIVIEWKEHFAWRPTRLDSGQIVWLTTYMVGDILRKWDYWDTTIIMSPAFIISCDELVEMRITGKYDRMLDIMNTQL